MHTQSFIVTIASQHVKCHVKAIASVVVVTLDYIMGFLGCFTVALSLLSGFECYVFIYFLVVL